MSRTLRVAAAQLGPIQKADSRQSVIDRLMALMMQAKDQGCQFVVFPETALTTFFPRWYMEDQAEVDQYFDDAMPNNLTQPLFDFAAENGIGFYLGYGEKCIEDGETHRYNTAILVDQSGAIVGKYRKVHLPGHSEYDTSRKWQHLEKRYFEVGNLGFPVWETMGGRFGMCICNDRRWPETFRVMGLQQVELVALGYNTPVLNSMSDEEGADLRMFHNHLSLQAGAYQNSTYVVASAKAGNEDGFEMMGGSAIVAPSGEILAVAKTVDDELIWADCDFDKCVFGRETIFNFAAHRRPEHYTQITEQIGAEE